MTKIFVAFLAFATTCAPAAWAQSEAAPSVYQVPMYSATGNVPGAPAAAVPGIFAETRQQITLGGAGFGSAITNPSNYGIAQSVVNVENALNASIATALSVIPVASPSSAVITRYDPATGAELPVSSTLGPIFTERAETIGKHKFYVGVSKEDFHFTTLNGQSLNTLRILYPGGDPSNITHPSTGQPITTYPATFDIGMDVRLSQNLLFLTYGVTNRFDVSVGLPLVHAAVQSRTYNLLMYVGNGLNNTGNGNCWCVDTITPGSPPTASANGLGGLVLPEVGQMALGKTGFGDLLLRFKGSAFATSKAVIALGADLRLPTGDEKNYLGIGTTSVKPFLAASFYNKPLSHGIVFSPHLNVGWQFSGKSILGGQLQGTPQTVNGVTYIGAPFTSTKDYLPDVFSWAAGSEVALGKHNTVVVDILGNEIGWIHGMPNTKTESIPNVPYPSTGPVQLVTASGLVSAGRVSFGEYNAAIGYKARVAGNLVATFSILVRLDNNSLVARAVPFYGLSYTF